MENFDYDENINAMIRAKNRGEDKATRDYLILAVLTMMTIWGAVIYWLN